MMISGVVLNAVQILQRLNQLHMGMDFAGILSG